MYKLTTESNDSVFWKRMEHRNRLYIFANYNYYHNLYFENYSNLCAHVTDRFAWKRFAVGLSPGKTQEDQLMDRPRRIAQTPLVASRHDTTRHTRRVERIERVVTSVSWWWFVSCHACSNMADDEEAVVIACTSLVFCALDSHQSRKKWGGHVHPMQSTLWRRPLTRVVRAALVVTGVSRRAVRQARHSTSRLFPVRKCTG